MMVNACRFVKQYLDGKSCESFQNYFQINKHSKGMRNSNALIKLPSVKLEFGKKSFRVQIQQTSEESLMSILTIEQAHLLGCAFSFLLYIIFSFQIIFFVGF